MINLEICRFDQAQSKISNVDIALSLIDPEFAMGRYESIAPHHAVIKFDDISMPREGYITPSIEHIKEIIDFARRVEENSNVLIHCHQGISRSPAAAIIVLMEKGIPPLEAMMEIKKIRPLMDPNLLMLKLYGQIVNRLESIMSAYDLWKQMDLIERQNQRGKLIWPTDM